MKFLGGDSYPHLCNRCQAAITGALEIIMVVGSDEDDPEAPLSYAADHRTLCGGYQCDVYHDEDVQDTGDSFVPRWSIFLLRDDWKNRVTYVIPICSAFDDWPIHGGTVDQIAAQYNFVVAPPDPSRWEPGCPTHMHRDKDVWLTFHEFGEYPTCYMGWSIASMIPSLMGSIEWGLWL